MLADTRRAGAPSAIAARVAMLPVVAGTAIGVVVAAAPAVGGDVPVAILQVVLVLASAAVLVRSVQGAADAVRRGEGPRRLGSAVFGFGALLGIALPGAQLMAGVRESRLSILGMEPLNIEADVAAAYGIFLLALVAFTAGEVVGDRAVRGSPSRFGAALQARRTYWVLLALGILTAVLAPAGDQEQAFSTRGEIEGQGIVTLLRWSLPVAVAIAVLERHWRSRTLVVLNLAVVLFLLQGGSRSPLVLVGLALGLRLLERFAHARHRLAVVLPAVAAVWAAATLMVGYASWRGEIIRGDRPSLVAEIGQAASDPFGRLTRAGVDSLDGLILASKADPEAVGASWTDPSKAVTGFIPHQLWPEKPDWLGNQVTEYYLGIGGGGLFLTAPGYALVVFGGVPGVAALLFAMGLLSGAGFRRFGLLSFATLSLTYFLLRSLFGGGDAFDAFHVLGLWALLVFAGGIAAALGQLAPSREAR